MHQLSRDLNMWIVISNFVLMHLKVLKHLISSLWGIVVSQYFLNINTTLKVKIYSWLWPLWWEKWCQSPVVFLVSVLKSLLKRIVCLLLLNSYLFLVFFAGFCWNISTTAASNFVDLLDIQLHLQKYSRKTLWSITHMLETIFTFIVCFETTTFTFIWHYFYLLL